MKFLIFNIVVICAYAGLVECQPLNTRLAQRTDELLRRTNFVITLVSGQIKLQTNINRHLFAELLEEELRALTLVVLELRNTQQVNATDASIDRLERRLEAVEERISSQFRAIGHEFVGKREIHSLLDRTRQLISLVLETVQRLRTSNRSLSALALLEEKGKLEQLEIKLRETQNPNYIRILEELLVQTEHRVNEIVNKLKASGISRKKTELKAVVLARVQQLLRLANQFVRELKKQRNRTKAAKIIERKVAEIQVVIIELTNATIGNDVLPIEDRLFALEIALMEDLRTVDSSLGANHLRRQLNKIERTILKREELELESLLSKIQSPIGQNVVESGFILFDELRRIARAKPYRKVLLRIAEELSLRITVEIRNLQRANRTPEASTLRAEQKKLILFQVKMRDAVTKQELVRLETRLRRIEKRIYDELVRLALISVRNDILFRTTELIKITKSEIAALSRQNRTAPVIILKNDEWKLHGFVAELNKATLIALNIDQLKRRLIVNEFQLADDLRRLGRPIDPNEWTDLLMIRAEALHEWIVGHIVAGKNHSLEELKKVVVNVIGLLRNGSLRSDLELLEDRLNIAEESMNVELRAIGTQFVSRDQIVALERRAEQLFIKLLVQTRHLFSIGRTQMAEALLENEKTFVDIYVELRVLLSPQRIARLEARMLEAESRFSP